jgi:hypothetical protein
MSRSKSSQFSAELKFVQLHQLVRVEVKKMVVSDFSKFPLSNRKKNSCCRAIPLSPLGRETLSAELLKKSRLVKVFQVLSGTKRCRLGRHRPRDFLAPGTQH